MGGRCQISLFPLAGGSSSPSAGIPGLVEGARGARGGFWVWGVVENDDRSVEDGELGAGEVGLAYRYEALEELSLRRGAILGDVVVVVVVVVVWRAVAIEMSLRTVPGYLPLFSGQNL